MQLTITHEEAEILSALLKAYVPDLGEEIYQTENFNLREELKRREQVLKAVLIRLGAMLHQPRPC